MRSKGTRLYFAEGKALGGCRLVFSARSRGRPLPSGSRVLGSHRNRGVVHGAGRGEEQGSWGLQHLAEVTSSGRDRRGPGHQLVTTHSNIGVNGHSWHH